MKTQNCRKPGRLVTPSVTPPQASAGERKRASAEYSHGGSELARPRATRREHHPPQLENRFG